MLAVAQTDLPEFDQIQLSQGLASETAVLEGHLELSS